MYPLIGLYLLVPVLSPRLRIATAKQERMFLHLWALTTCLPFVNKFYGGVLGQYWWNQYHMLYNFSGYSGCLTLGHHIRYHISWARLKCSIIELVCLLGGTSFTVLSFYLQAKPDIPQQLSGLEITWCFCIINCVIATFGAFVLFTTIQKAGKIYGLVKSISVNSYGMFLIHMPWLPFWISTIQPQISIAAATPPISILAFISCYITIKFISYLPNSKWVME